MRNIRNEISNFQQKFDESFHEAWERYKDLLRACPHYGFTELHQLDTFYNALNPADQDSLNAAVGGNLLEKSPQDALTIIENKSKCLAAGGNTFPKYRDNIQGYISAATGNFNQGLPELIPTRMTLELANRAICTPNRIARDVFIPVGKFTFLADFVVVDYESDPRVSLILGRPFLRTARALIGVHGEEMILRDEDESEDCLKDLVSNKLSGNPTFSLHKEIALPEVIPEFHDSKGLPLIQPTRCLKSSLMNLLLSHILRIMMIIVRDIESDIREIEFLLYQGEDYDFKDPIDQSVLTNCDDLFVDPTLEMFTDKQPLDYSFPPRFDVYPDDFLEIESDANTVDDDSFDSEGRKIKEAKLLIDPLDLPCDILSEYDSFNSQDFSRDDVLPSPDNEDKVFNPGILIHEKSVKIITHVTQEKKLAVSFDSWLSEDFDLPFYELLVFKEVPNSMRLLPFSFENEEKVFKPGIYSFKKFHCCFLPELSHP
nr:reverse transcriptase domain-containing protein [Tanacetum cinerariifolium]